MRTGPTPDERIVVCQVMDAFSTNEEDGDLIATSRTALPILASALKKLVPYVDHIEGCALKNRKWRSDYPRKCSCGLYSALSEIEGKV